MKIMIKIKTIIKKNKIKKNLYLRKKVLSLKKKIMKKINPQLQNLKKVLLVKVHKIVVIII